MKWKKIIELPINVYDMMKKYKDENRSFVSFMKGLPKNPNIWGWCNYPKYGSKEETLMQAWLDFDKVKTLALYYVKLPKLITSDGSQRYLSCKDMTYFASRKNDKRNSQSVCKTSKEEMTVKSILRYKGVLR